jgi:hypothetical protein
VPDKSRNRKLEIDTDCNGVYRDLTVFPPLIFTLSKSLTWFLPTT